MKPSNVLVLSCFLFFLFINNAMAAEGCTEGNCYNGRGTFKWSSGNEYSGTFKNGSRDGEGVFTFANGDKYIGEYKAGKRNGMGIYFFNDGMKYEGEYVDDIRSGFGIFTMTNGARYEGEYKDGMKHGQGKFFFPDGKVVNGAWRFGAFVEPDSTTNVNNGSVAAAYSLTINSMPPDATVKFIENTLEYEPGMKLSPGRYKVTVSHPRYKARVEYIDIMEKDLVVPVFLKLADIPAPLKPKATKVIIDQAETVPADKAKPSEVVIAQAETAPEDEAKPSEVVVIAQKETAPADEAEPSEVVIAQKETAPADEAKQGLVRGVELNQEDVTYKPLLGKDKTPAELDKQKIDAAMAENDVGQKLSMIEQLQQEVEMLKASFSAPQLLSLQELPGSNNNFDRVALVIGNSQYPLIGELRNPEHDAKDVAEALRKLNFNVTVKLNIDQQEMEEAIIEFGERIKEDSVGLFYYAGHGAQIGGENYLIPVQARIKKAKDIRYKAVDLNMLIDEMVAANNGKNIIILDACRNNPLPKEESRHASIGLARTDAPAGSLIAYATSPGSVAIDGEGRNGIYTRYLLEHIFTPGIPIEMVFKRVLQGVASDTERKQIPWMSSSLDIDFSFATN